MSDVATEQKLDEEHMTPLGDWFQHVTPGTDCPCRPIASVVTRIQVGPGIAPQPFVRVVHLDMRPEE